MTLKEWNHQRTIWITHPFNKADADDDDEINLDRWLYAKEAQKMWHDKKKWEYEALQAAADDV